jgi:hypothetical protein
MGVVGLFVPEVMQTQALGVLEETGLLELAEDVSA